MLPIFDNGFVPVSINQDEPPRMYPLRSVTKKTNKTHPTKDDQETEDDYLFREFLAVMFGSNEVGDYEKQINKEKAAKRAQVKKTNKKKNKITTTIADESDSETTVDHGWDENNDDEYNKKATRSYQSTANVEETIEHESNEVPLIDDNDELNSNTPVEDDIPADGDNLNAGDDNLEVDGDILEDNILKLIESLDLTSEKEIDKLLAQISDETYNQETIEEDKKQRNTRKKKLKSSRKDKNAAVNVDTPYGNVYSDEIYDHNILDDGVSETREDNKDLTLREKKTNNNEKEKSNEGDSIFDYLPKEDMYQLLAQAVDEITKTDIQEQLKN